jgi:oxygen-independent coproporphyrinogen-3 oxidase
MSIKRGSYLDGKYDAFSPDAADNVNAMLKFASENMEKNQKQPYYMYRQKNMLGNLENVGYCSEGHECLYNIFIMEELQDIYAVGAGAVSKFISPNGGKIERIFEPKYTYEYINM